MRQVIVILAILAAALPAGAAAPSTAAAKTCSRDVHAVIGGEEKCLGAGEYCATRYERQYVHYGFECAGSPARLRRRR